VKRREFITLLGSAAAAWPLAARAQRPAKPVIGFLNTQSPDVFSYLVTGFRQGLRETGYVEGENLTIEYRWAENHYDRLSALAADLVGSQVSVIAATGGSVSALAAKAATGTIPIVFLAGDLDAVQAGLVASMNRPGGNVTGVIPLISVLGPKRLELLREIVPKAAIIGMLVNPDFPDADTQSRDLQKAALNLGLQHHILSASSEPEFEIAFAMFRARQIDALIIGNDALFNSRRGQLVNLAARYGIPAIYPLREFAEAGGLMSYGPSLVDAYRQAGIYTGRILKGDKPADLPVTQSSRFEMVINLKTARTLGLDIPLKLHAFADAVIE
jgi:putative tryptophan/tyrosine transport system substrate-binding protein